MQQPREQRKVKREKKWYFLAKMIKISPEGTPILFTFHFSLFTQVVYNKEMTPDRNGQGSFLFLGFNHWITSLSAGSTGLSCLVGIPSAAFTFFSLRSRLAFM